VYANDPFVIEKFESLKDGEPVAICGPFCVSTNGSSRLIYKINADAIVGARKTKTRKKGKSAPPDADPDDAPKDDWGRTMPCQTNNADDDVEPFDHAPTSDDALALRFAERHAADLRYVAAWAKWLIWDGGEWRVDKMLRAFNMARQLCREAAAECNKPARARSLASAKTVYAVERLARSDRRLAATAEEFGEVLSGKAPTKEKSMLAIGGAGK
jgi:hypothetical protein